MSVEVDSLEGALDAIAAGATDLVVGDWAPDQVGALRDAIAPRALLERTALPPETEIDDAREALPRPLFTAWLSRSTAPAWSARATPGHRAATRSPPSRRGACRPSGRTPPGARAHPTRASSRLAPELAGILERSLEGTPPRVAEIERLFRARGPEVEAVARVADPCVSAPAATRSPT